MPKTTESANDSKVPATKRELRSKLKSLRKQYAVGDKVTFSQIMLKTSSDDLRQRREHLKKEYGFTIEEQRYIARQKPNFMLYDKDETRGIASLSDLLTGKYGFS